MATYANKRFRLFLGQNEFLRPLRRRSEARLKTYPSSEDIRTWGGNVEERRQHILELMLKAYNKCSGNIIPLKTLIDILMAMAGGDSGKLKNCLKQLWNFIEGLRVSGADLTRLQKMRGQMDPACVNLEEANEDNVMRREIHEENAIRREVQEENAIRREVQEEECVAQDRHAREQKSIERLLGVDSKPTIKSRFNAPGKMVTRIKGLQPGYQIVEDPSNPNHMKIVTSKQSSTSSINKSKSTGDVKQLYNQIEKLTKERDDLKMKLDSCLQDLAKFRGAGNFDDDATIIRDELETLRQHCQKLKNVEDENSKLKTELIESIKCDTLKDKLKQLEELTRERDELANKVLWMEKKLAKYHPEEDVELLRNRSDMLDGVMEERDGLRQKLNTIRSMEQEIAKLKTKADRVDDLERQLKNFNKGDRSSGIELRKTQSKAGSLEIELQNMKTEKNALIKRLETMKKECESQKSKCTETEMLRLERDRLQIKLNELADIQSQYEDLMTKMKIFDNLKAERDMYKQKYEEVLDMECKCEMMRAQLDEARELGHERDYLKKQVEDMEACMCGQDQEIKSLSMQVFELSKTRNDAQNRLNQEEAAKKDRIRQLEKLLHNAEHTILQKDSIIKSLEQKHACGILESIKKELEVAKAENKRLQEIANKMTSITGDDNVKKMLQQSECAVKRIAEELGKQYQEWDNHKKRSPTTKTRKMDCICPSSGGEISSGDDCEKLRVELGELQREQNRLQTAVRQLQHSNCPKNCKSKI